MSMVPITPSAPGLGGGANKFATGNKSYGPGMIGAATSGTVNKTGYLERERQKKLRQLAIQNAMKFAGAPANLGTTQPLG